MRTAKWVRWKQSLATDPAPFHTYAQSQRPWGLVRSGEARASVVDFAVVMSATAQRCFIRACKADVVLKTSGPQIPIGLGSPQCRPLVANSPEPRLQLRADSGSLKRQRAGLVHWGWPPCSFPPIAACNHHVDSWVPFPLHPLCSKQPPRASPPCPGPGSDLYSFPGHDRCLPFIPHCLPMAHSGDPGSGSGNKGIIVVFPLPL